MCLPCKEPEDGGMSTVAADLYAEVVANLPVPNVDKRAPIFYKRSVEVQQGVTRLMIENKLLSHDQIDRLRAVLQQFCYRADNLIAWSRTTEADIPAHVAAWTQKLFEWSKSDQEFFQALINEIGDWYKYAK